MMMMIIILPSEKNAEGGAARVLHGASLRGTRYHYDYPYYYYY